MESGQIPELKRWAEKGEGLGASVSEGLRGRVFFLSFFLVTGWGDSGGQGFKKQMFVQEGVCGCIWHSWLSFGDG